MGFINKFLNIFKKKQSKLGYINQGGNISSSSYTFGPAPQPVSVWEGAILNTQWECVQCGTYDPANCNHCLIYANFIYDHAPDLTSAVNHLAEIYKYNQYKKDNLYSWEDYEKDK
jgi:hypothetical protein